MPFKELKKRDGTDKHAAQQGGSFQSVRILLTGSSIHDSRPAQDLVAWVDYPRPYAGEALGIDEDRIEGRTTRCGGRNTGTVAREASVRLLEALGRCEACQDTLGRFGGL